MTMSTSNSIPGLNGLPTEGAEGPLPLDLVVAALLDSCSASLQPGQESLSFGDAAGTWFVLVALSRKRVKELETTLLNLPRLQENLVADTLRQRLKIREAELATLIAERDRLLAEINHLKQGLS